MDILGDAVRIAESYCDDVPEHVDVTLDKNSFAAGYLAAAGGIKHALVRLKERGDGLSATVRVLIALDEDARVRECVVLTDDRQADDLYHRLRKIWGGANVAMASRLVDDVPPNLHDRTTQMTTEIIQ